MSIDIREVKRIMKNVLLLCMSAIKEEGIKENQYVYTLSDGKKQDEVWGFVTNEAPMRYVMKMVFPNKLDRIVIICSDEVSNRKIEISKCNESGKEVGNQRRDSFQEKIQKLFLGKKEFKLLDYYKKLVELETEDYDYVPEYKEIPIPDNPEDTEVAEAVINEVNNVMEFPDKDNDIHLYIDYNGGPRYVAFMQVVLAQFLKTRNVQLEQIITMNFDNKQNGKVPLQNLLSIFDSTNLIGSINEYTNYGRIKGLKEYFKKAQNKEINKLLDVMEEFSNNLQLCRTSSIMESAGALSKEFETFINKAELEEQSKKDNTYTQLFRYVIRDIQKEFQPLLNKDIAEIIGWCIEKQYIQQALTFCSECLPQYLWDTGLYKAKDEEYKDVLQVIDDVDNKTNGRENPSEELKEAIDEKRKYFSKEEKYAYKWFVQYLPFCFQDDKYLIILSEIKELPNMPEKYKADVKEMSAPIKKKQYLKSCMKKTESEKYDKANENASNNAAKLMWHYENGRVQSKVTEQNKEALEEIIYIYFFMKGQRNAANHADGKKNGFEYADICEVLTYLVKKLKMQNEKRKG